MNKGIVPRSGIDTADARWGFSHTKGWVFGYKLHLISSTGSTTITVVPLAADFTTANVQDNQLYNPMTASSSSSVSTETCFMIDR
jgi:Transposase DDE domain